MTLLANPFFLAYVLIGGLALVWANYMDGAEIVNPQTHYNFDKVLISTLINWLWIFAIVYWQISHV